MPDNDKIRVLIVDDIAETRENIRKLLQFDSEFEVAGAARSGKEAIELSKELKPDVVLMDINMPGMSGIECVRRLKPQMMETQFVMLTVYEDPDHIFKALTCGASGYLLKDDQASIRDLQSIIELVADDGVYLSPYAYQQLLKRRTGALAQPLTPRQLEALSLAAAYPDASTAGLAILMNIAPSTLRNILSGAYLKLNVRTRATAVAKARQMGLITPDVPLPDFKSR